MRVHIKTLRHHRHIWRRSDCPLGGARDGLRNLLRNLLAALAFAGSSAVIAHQASSGTPKNGYSADRVAAAEPQAQRKAAEAETANQMAQLKEIIVTASKRAEPLGKTPIAVTALSQTQLEESGVTQVKDLTGTVPNVEMGTVAYTSAIILTIRGIGNADFNEGGDPAIATYVDGVYVAHTQGLNDALYDLARVEVLRGPQGTLYGLNSTGGNLNIVTADPKQTFGAEADVSLGNYNDVQTHGMVNVPVASDLAVRASFETHRSDGYYNTQGTTDRRYGASDNFGGRLTALWTPSNSFTWRLSTDDFREEGTPGLDIDTSLTTGRPADGLPVYDRPVNSSPSPTLYTNNFMVRSRMDWQLQRHVTVSYIAGYQTVASSNTLDDDGTAVPIFAGLAHNDRSVSYSHEIDVNYTGDRLQNIVGATYFHHQLNSEGAFWLYPQNLSLSYKDVVHNVAWGIFDQAEFKVADGLRLVGGLRYSQNSKSLENDIQEYCDVGVPANLILADVLVPGEGCSLAPIPNDSGTWSKISWKAGLQYDVSAETMAYLTVATGFKSGGLNTGQTVDRTFLPENVINYEAGLKTHFLNDSARVNTAVFYEKYSDLQVNQIIPSGEASVTTNAAKAAIYGLELEGQWRFTDSDELSGFLDYLHATYTDYTNAEDSLTGLVVPDLSGKYLPHAPAESGRFQYSHDFSLPRGGTITPMVAVYWQTKNYLRGFDAPVDLVPSYTKTSLNLQYIDASGHWTVDGYARNLEDKAVRTNGIAVAGHFYSDYAPPRTFGVRFSYEY